MISMSTRLADIIAQGFIDDVPSVHIARSCIKALREPTEDMLAADPTDIICPMCGGWLEGWKTMIDAALAFTPPSHAPSEKG